MGFVSPLGSPARNLAPHPPSLFSPFSRETVPAQSSTDFLTHTLRPGQQERPVPARLRLFFGTPTLFKPRLIGQEDKGRLMSFKWSHRGVSDGLYAYTPCPAKKKEALPSKNASGRLNLRGRFSIPKLHTWFMERPSFWSRRFDPEHIEIKVLGLVDHAAEGKAGWHERPGPLAETAGFFFVL